MAGYDRLVFSDLVVCFCRNYPIPKRLVLLCRAPRTPFLERQVPILWRPHVVRSPTTSRAGLHSSENFLLHFFLILLFLSFYSLSSSLHFIPSCSHLTILPCPILLFLLLLYIYSLLFYRFIFILYYHFLFLRVTVHLHIILCSKLFRLSLLPILSLLVHLALPICILTRIYLHSLLLFYYVSSKFHPYYSFFVICYTFITSNLHILS